MANRYAYRVFLLLVFSVQNYFADPDRQWLALHWSFLVQKSFKI